jgi:alcohol dehydrogenase class IV
MTLTATWSYPTRVLFGPGRIAELAAACREAGLRRPLLVTDRGLREMGITGRALDLLEEAGLGRALFAEVDPNPTDRNLEEGLGAYRAGGMTGWWPLGAARGSTSARWSPSWWGRRGRFGTSRTWATGGRGPIRRDRADRGGADDGRDGLGGGAGERHHRQRAPCEEDHLHPKVLPRVVIADPELTLGLPPHITAGTGMDAFAHCLEAYCSPSFHPMSQGIALEGMRLVHEFLPRAFRDGGDIEARANMMAAGSMGAVAFQKGLGRCIR